MDARNTDFINYLDLLIENKTIFHGCFLVKQDLKNDFLEKHPEHHPYSDKAFNADLRAYTHYNNQLVSYTDKNKYQMDTTKHFAVSTAVSIQKRCFRFFFQ